MFNNLHPAIGAPIKYPPAQAVTIIPIATDNLADPNTFPTTVGMIAKKPPLAAPLMIANAISGASVCETGHRESMLTALKSSEIKSVFSGPTLSPIKPHRILPTPDEKLKEATSVVPT